MIRALLGVALLLFALSSAAQQTTRPEAAEAEHRASSLDPFDLLPDAGLGFDFTGTRDSDRFESRRPRVVGLTSFGSPYEFGGIAAGTDYFKQGDWSARGYSLWAIAEDRNRATAGGISARIGVSHIAGHGRALADAVWNHRFSPQTGTELIMQRDVVESRAAIEAGVTHAFLAASVDHAFTDRFSGIALVGAQSFSDGNDRAHLRGWLIYSVLPEYGLALQARARAYENSRRGSAFYFNPENYENADIGLRLRKRFAGWRVHALLAAGGERAAGSETQATKFAQLNVDRVLAGDIRIGVRYAYSRAAEDGTNVSGSGNYTWRYLRFFIVAPL